MTDAEKGPRVVALSGGVASGKTAASDRFGRLGVPVIDTDIIAREVVRPGTAGLEAVVARFGTDIVDTEGRLDRRRLRERVFRNEEARRDLERMLHPLIMDRVRERLLALTGCYCIVVIPLLVESGAGADLADRVLIVDVDEATQLDRLMQRDGMSRELARRMIDAQASRETRLARADDVIDNSGTLEALERQVDALHAAYLARCDSEEW